VNPNLNEIACVVDRSGSMAPLLHDSIGGFNRFLIDQKALPGEARLTLILFDYEYQIVHDSAPITAVPLLNAETYVPRGSTALLDAVGRTIDTIGQRLSRTPEDQRPAQVIVAILTDGKENASREYTHARVANKIKHQQEQYGWQFVFLGANMDAFAEAKALNIPIQNTASFAATSIGTQTAYETMSRTVSSLRAGNDVAGGLITTPLDANE